MGGRFFDHDPHTGITQYFHPSEDGEKFTITSHQDITALVDENRERFNEFSSARDSFGDGMELSARAHVARIPMVVYEELLRQGITRDRVAMKRWLNDPDNAVFRTRPGHI